MTWSWWSRSVSASNSTARSWPGVAVAENRALATANYQDFRPIHEVYLSRGDRHFGLVLIPRRFSLAREGFGRLIEALDRFLTEHASQTALQSAEAWLADD